MAGDSEDSRSKHRRSSSAEDSPENSKRHKNRHHHHHRRHRRHHHHRHSSGKHDEARKTEIEVENMEKVEDVRGIVSRIADYDMEEGEIIEDEGLLLADSEIVVKQTISDVESGEFKEGEGRSEFDESYAKGDAASGSPGTNPNLPSVDNIRRCMKNLKPSESDESKKHGGTRLHYDESPILENVVNGKCDNKSSKDESRSRTRCKSPSKGRSKDIIHRSKQPMDVDEDENENENGDQRNSFSHKVRDNGVKASSRSPSHSRYHLETSDRSRSESADQMKEREHNQRSLHEGRSRTHHRHERDDVMYENGGVDHELDDQRDSRLSTDYRVDSRSTDKGKHRERSSSRHRSSTHDGKHGDDSWDREREKKIYRDKKRVEEREPSRGRNERASERDRDWEKERDRTRGRDHEMERESDRDREKARDRKTDVDSDRERDGERKREKDNRRSRDRDLERERERRRDSSIPLYRNRDTERERDKGRDRERSLEMDRGRDNHNGRVRYRDRDVENDSCRRYHRYDNRGGYDSRDRHRGYDEAEYRRDRNRKHDSEKDRGSKYVSVKDNEKEVNRDDDDQQDYQERVELELAEQEEDDLNRIKEESRRRREAILQKYKAQQLPQQAVPQSNTVSNEEPKGLPLHKLATANAVQENVDTKADGRDASIVETSFLLGRSPLRKETTAVEETTGARGLGEGTPKSERSNDMFCDDIFGDSPAGVRKMAKGDGLPVERSGLHDNWDDPEGYYSFRFGEILDSRYEITAAHGKGVFSTVVRAKDLKAGSGDPEDVAIKIIRNNETMLKAGTEELVILKKLVGADPDDRRHCVRYLSHFKYRNHLCIVFESLHMNLREVLKKFGRNIGLKLTAVRTYAKQLFIALKHLRNCGVLHCDIKPDNMLVNDAKNVLKLCDFGNAMFAGKNEVTPYLVSRFYRAPEIILGLTYDHPMDMWSVGCCLYELYTGKVLFPGSTNNDMLRLHMELKGPFPKKMLRKGAFIEPHFDQDLNFLATEEDPVTKKNIRRLILNIKPKDIATIIKGSPGEDPKMLANFKDLLDKIFVLDPDKRLTVSQALNHPFITGK